MADRLRKAREQAGMEQEDLAALIEVSRGTVSNYEHGKVSPKRIVVRQWAAATGVSLDWIWGDDRPFAVTTTTRKRPTNPCLSDARGVLDTWRTKVILVAA